MNDPSDAVLAGVVAAARRELHEHLREHLFDQQRPIGSGNKNDLAVQGRNSHGRWTIEITEAGASRGTSELVVLLHFSPTT